MKAFEDWQRYKDLNEYSYEETWKAALKWVLSDSCDKGFCQCGCIENSIEKELEDD